MRRLSVFRPDAPVGPSERARLVRARSRVRDRPALVAGRSRVRDRPALVAGRSRAVSVD